MFNSRQEADFNDSVIGNILEEAVYWIQANLNPEEVFDKEELEDWAEDNGFVKESDKYE